MYDLCKVCHKYIGDRYGAEHACVLVSCPNRTRRGDPVNHPPHYNAHPSGIECIQVTEHMNFNLGNAMKYIWRAEGKGGVEDLKKARWYLDREITRLETKG